MIEHCAHSELDITSIEVYSAPYALQAVYARLRREVPVLRINRAPYRPFWALTRHAEISEVSRQNKLFIDEPRLTLTSQSVEDRVQAQNMGRRVIDRMAELDGHSDFAQDVANLVPLHVIMALLGLPEEDAPFILRGTQPCWPPATPICRVTHPPMALM